MSDMDRCIRKLEHLEDVNYAPSLVKDCLNQVLPLVRASEEHRDKAEEIERLVAARNAKAAAALLRDPKSGAKTALLVGAILAASVGFIALLFVLVPRCDPGKPVDKTFRAFIADLEHGRLDRAYARMSPDYRSQVTLETFRGAIQAAPLLRTAQGFKQKWYKVGKGRAEYYGQWKAKAGKAMASVLFVELDGKWYVDEVVLDNKDALPKPTPKEPTPAPAP